MLSLKLKPCFFRLLSNCLRTSPSCSRSKLLIWNQRIGEWQARSFSACLQHPGVKRTIVGTMMGPNSTTVTCDPSRSHTLPISRPMYPPPITISLFGTSFRTNAPVDETTLHSPSANRLGRKCHRGRRPCNRFICNILCLQTSLNELTEGGRQSTFLHLSQCREEVQPLNQLQ